MNTCALDSADIALTRGNNWPPAKWQFLVSENPDVLFDLSGSVFKLTVIWPGGTIVKATNADADLVIDLPTSIVTWNYSAAESRSLPLGRIAQYELERWIGGTQQTHIGGYLAVSQGFNPD